MSLKCIFSSKHLQGKSTSSIVTIKAKKAEERRVCLSRCCSSLIFISGRQKTEERKKKKGKGKDCRATWTHRWLLKDMYRCYRQWISRPLSQTWQMSINLSKISFWSCWRRSPRLNGVFLPVCWQSLDQEDLLKSVTWIAKWTARAKKWLFASIELSKKSRQWSFACQSEASHIGRDRETENDDLLLSLFLL